jgi:catechol 1,2-dioxygenase
VTGPFYRPAPALENGAIIARGPEWARGGQTTVRGRVVAVDGQPIAGATVEVWQADDAGNYDSQDALQPADNLRGTFHTDAEGRYWFRTVKPTSYPVPVDGPVGELLRAVGRHPMRPAHIHFKVTAPGYRRLITHVFVAGDPYLDSDAVFGVKQSLVAPFDHAAAESSDQSYPGPAYLVRFDICLERASQEVDDAATFGK